MEMATKVSNFSDLIQRVTASCLLHPLAATRSDSRTLNNLIIRSTDSDSEEDDDNDDELHPHRDDSSSSSKEEGEELSSRAWKKEIRQVRAEKVMEMEMLMSQVFYSVSSLKKAYLSLQQAHSPWDPDQLRSADVAVIEELRKLGVLRERFRRGLIYSDGDAKDGNMNTKAAFGDSVAREVAAPYEAAVEELKRQVKAKDAEVENLKDKLRGISSDLTPSTKISHEGRRKNGKSRSHSHSHSHSHSNSNSFRKVSPTTSQLLPVGGAPTPELFEATVMQVKETQKSFTAMLLSLMRTARWDISSAVRSIEASFSNTASATQPVAENHAKYALESYVSGKIFQGFDHETFYMDGSLSSLLQPDQFRRDCFTQYRDMKAMDPVELLGILPTCPFGKFCSKKYLAIVHPKMEESLFGNLEQHRQVVAGNHPRSQFYGEFLGMAKAVWSLHLLAFSLDPPPSRFEASCGAEFHSQFMESVVRFPGGRVPVDHIVGFPVSPGFKLGNGSVIKARVHLNSRS